jgi:magnesium transporter
VNDVISIYVRGNAGTQCASQVDPAWLDPLSDVTFWVDLSSPTPEEGRLLGEVFHFHPLSVEDALGAVHHPKVEPYAGYLYLILHGINFKEEEHWFATHDVDFFLGRNYLVTIHDGHSRSIAKVKGICDQHDRALSEGPVALLHRIVDSMVENYRPEIESLESHMNALEDEAILGRRAQARSGRLATGRHPAARRGWSAGTTGVRDDR